MADLAFELKDGLPMGLLLSLDEELLLSMATGSIRGGGPTEESSKSGSASSGGLMEEPEDSSESGSSVGLV